MHGICDMEKEKNPLEVVQLPDPIPQDEEVLVKVPACGVYHVYF